MVRPGKRGSDHGTALVVLRNEGRVVQALSVGALTTVVVLLLSATYQLQAPFAGSVRIEPEAFKEVLGDIQRRQRSEHY